MLTQHQLVSAVVSSSTVSSELWDKLRMVVREGQPLGSSCKANSSRFCLFLRPDSSTEGAVEREEGQPVALQESRAVLMAEVCDSHRPLKGIVVCSNSSVQYSVELCRVCQYTRQL